MILQKERRKASGSAHRNERFENLDFRNAIIEGSTFDWCFFVNCKFDQASLAGSVFRFCVFRECEMRQTVMMARFEDTAFRHCTMDQGTFRAAIITNCRFEFNRMEYVVFSRATIVDSKFWKCALHGAYFDLADSRNNDFRSCNLWGVVIPLSCAFVTENKFDHRQLNMMLGLLTHAKYDEDEGSKLLPMIDPKVKRLVDRLVASANREKVSLDGQ